jgi:hypothetical protein
VVVQLSGSEQLELLSAATGRAEPSQRASAPVKIFHLFLFLRLADSIQTVEKKKRVRNRQKKIKKNKNKVLTLLGLLHSLVRGVLSFAAMLTLLSREFLLLLLLLFPLQGSSSRSSSCC